MYNLGFLCEETIRNDNLAKEWYTKAAKHGDLDAMTKLVSV